MQCIALLCIGNAVKQWTLDLNWSEEKSKRQRIDTVVLKQIQCVGLQHTGFSPTCHALVTCFELLEGKIDFQ